MTPRPLHEIRLSWRDHKHALWWLGLLYRKPRVFQEVLQTRSNRQQTEIAIRTYLHFLTYQILFCLLGRLLLFGGFGRHFTGAHAAVGAALLSHGIQAAVGIAVGIASGIGLGTIARYAVGAAVGIAVAITFGITAGTTAGIAVANPFGIISGTTFGITVGIIVGIAFATTVGTAVRVARGIYVGVATGITFGPAVGITFGIAAGITFGVAAGIASGITLLRFYYNFIIELNIIVPIIDRTINRPHWYPLHPVAWDDCCSVPFRYVDVLLAAYTEIEPVKGIAEIQRLIDDYPSQRVPALRARTRLLAREAGRVADLARIGDVLAKLPEGSKGFLAETARVRELAAEIARLQARLNGMDRPTFREPFADSLYTAVENFQHRVAGLQEPLKSEFTAAARNWLDVARRQRDDVRRVTGREQVRQVFRAGDPVDRNQEAFVPRDRVVGRLEQQVMLPTGCPGIVLYGRRRMGKSTVLKNLDGFLPPTVGTVLVRMQEAEAFTSLGLFCGLLGGRVREAWPGGAPPGSPPGDLPGLGRLLADCDRELKDRGKRLILAIDEYEYIDKKIGEGVFSEDLLALVRESIQSQRNLTWVFAGSHGIEELTAAPWTSYLVSARTVEVPPFTEDETRLLLTEPLKSSDVWPRDLKRPHFEPGFWGENGVTRVHAEAGGWPHLVQLVAECIVDLVNESDRREVDEALWAKALDEAVVRGDTVFRQLLVGESRHPDEMAYLAGFRTRESQPPPADEAVARSLRRRLVVVPEGDDWRLRAPLFRRWLRTRY